MATATAVATATREPVAVEEKWVAPEAAVEVAQEPPLAETPPVEAVVVKFPVAAVESPSGEEKAGEVGTIADFEPVSPEEQSKFKTDVEYVEGIGQISAQKLKVVGVTTLLDLLKRGATPKGRQEIAEQTGISHKLILRWVNHVDLMRIKGVGSEYADLLEASGVDTVVELSHRVASNLYDKMLVVNEEKKLVRKPPVLSQVEDWVAQAKALPRAIFY
jgi:predicted flap endonuclease-1-like 5' DNA nuclease